MGHVKFTIVDRSKQYYQITTEENDTIETLMNKFFPTKKNYTLQLKYNTQTRVIGRSETVKNILLEGILIEEQVEYLLIDSLEYIDVYINLYTRNSLRIDKKNIRIYVNEETQIFHVEENLTNLFCTSSQIYGLYGFHLTKKNNPVFKLKQNEYVLFLKRCFKHENFFQYQFNECIEALENMKSNYEGNFYRIDHFEQRLLFKKSFVYSLRENTLSKIKNNKIYESFFNVDKASISCEKFYGKNMIKIEGIDKTWILCTFSVDICQDMYNAIVSVINNNVFREVEKNIQSHAIDNQVIGEDKSNLSLSNKNRNLDEIKYQNLSDSDSYMEFSSSSDINTFSSNNQQEKRNSVISNDIDKFISSSDVSDNICQGTEKDLIDNGGATKTDSDYHFSILSSYKKPKKRINFVKDVIQDNNQRQQK
ncbi:hypothetical protein COBT_001318 [Conglomerata obtusa]